MLDLHIFLKNQVDRLLAKPTGALATFLVHLDI